MPPHFLNLDISPRKILIDHTRLGGKNRQGESYGVTSAYLTHNGKPFVGISGEFQFSRYPESDWEEELLKMKASGINMIATYVFWIHHEEQPGVFDWGGRKDLRRFVQLCGRHALPVIARIGPFAHGECRNGGLPDWLYGMPFPVRSNHPAYLDCVKRYYAQVADQLRGLLFQDGGPVVCIQLDNEYEHTGAPWDSADRSAPVEWLPRGNDGVSHMRHLKQIAEEVGMVTPLYTVTAWGSPVIEDETLPVYGGYAYPVWVEDPGPSDLYIFFDRQAQTQADAHPNHQADHYPLINAEMQGGIQVRYNNRPVIPPQSTEALTLVQIGSGCNFIGYYIYHGGSHPAIHGAFANEVLHPQVSYDFQAPIGEFGEIRDAARYVKTLHLFLQSFGEELAPMQAVFPPGQIAPEDTSTLRYAARVKDDRAFLFFNNFQDHIETKPISPLSFDIQIGGEKVTLPRAGTLTLEEEVCCLLPLNLDMRGARLVYATTQPLTILEKAGETHYFFFAPQGVDPEYCFADETLSMLLGDTGEIARGDGRVWLNPQAGWQNSFTFLSPSGRRVRVTTLTRKEAEHSWIGTAWGDRRLVISPADPIFIDDQVEFVSSGSHEFAAMIFPPVEKALNADGLVGQEEFPIATSDGGRIAGTFAENSASQLKKTPPLATILHMRLEEKRVGLDVESCQEANKRHLHFPADMMGGVKEVFLSVDYTGDIAGAYVNGQLVADNYNNGTPWVIGLKRFIPDILQHGLVLRFRPLRKGHIKNVSNSMAARMDFVGEEKLEILRISAIPEYAVRVKQG